MSAKAAAPDPKGRPEGERAPKRVRAKGASKGKQTSSKSRRRTPQPAGSESTLAGAARQVRAWSDTVLGIAGAAADVSLGAAKAILVRPEQRAGLAKAGNALRALREAAGLSVQELGRAVDLSDPALLELVENGKVALPFEIVLRLAAVLGRNDPVPFVMRFTRTWNPQVWHTLESLGIGRLAVQAGREREFANIYRASDDARTLDDAAFAAVLAFTQSAFDLAMTLHRRDAKVPRKRSAPEASDAKPATRGRRKA